MHRPAKLPDASEAKSYELDVVGQSLANRLLSTAAIRRHLIPMLISDDQLAMEQFKPGRVVICFVPKSAHA